MRLYARIFTDFYVFAILLPIPFVFFFGYRSLASSTRMWGSLTSTVHVTYCALSSTVEHSTVALLLH